MVSIHPELNAEFTFDGKRNTLIGSDFTSIDTKMGIEAGYKEFVFLRGGISQFQTKKNLDGTETYSVVPTLGIGIKLNNLIIDYALADVGKGSGTLPFSNIISLRLSINRQN